MICLVHPLAIDASLVGVYERAMNKHTPPRPALEPIVVAPSILSADFARLGEEIAAVQAAGADWIHVDVMDGAFVPNITIGLPVVESIRRTTDLPLDVHLMIERADLYAERFAQVGADRVLVHVEADRHIHRTLAGIRGAGAAAGVVLNPGTPVEHVRGLLPFVDQVLVMSVNPGFGGQRFIPETLRAVRVLAEWIADHVAGGGSPIVLEMDGGIAPDTIGAARAAGADAFVAGSAIFGRPDYARAIAELRHAAGAGIALAPKK